MAYSQIPAENEIRPSRTDLVRILRTQWQARRAELEAQYVCDQRLAHRPDWPWSGFIVSFATNGGSKRFEQKIAPRVADFAWERVVRMSPEERRAAAMDLANPRRRHIVVPAFEACFQRLLAAGGPPTIRTEYLSFDSADGRIRYLKSFLGIGDKYARNMAMDVCDPLVVDSFALDSRLRGIAGLVLRPMPGYRATEAWLRDVAGEVGIRPWYLDRLMYRDYNFILAELRRAGVSGCDGSPAVCGLVGGA